MWCVRSTGIVFSFGGSYYTMDDAAIERARLDLQRYWERRRQRGIHPNGRPAELLRKGGLTLLEV